MKDTGKYPLKTFVLSWLLMQPALVRLLILDGILPVYFVRLLQWIRSAMDLHAQNFPDQSAGSAARHGQQPVQEIEDHLIYWKRQLADAPMVLDLPTDHPRTSNSRSRSARHFFGLPQALSDALKTLSRQEGVNLFITLLAAFQTLLFRYTGQDDLLIGTPNGERAQDRIALVGDASSRFVDMLVLRTRIAGNLSFRDLLGRVGETVLEAYAHQDMPFEQLVEALQPEQDSNFHPLYQVMFALDEHTPTRSEFVLHPGGVVPMVDLVLAAQYTERELRGWFWYNADLFETASIQRMADHWQRLLEGIVEDPSLQLSALPLLTEEQRQQLVVEWNDTTADYPVDLCVHQLFEAQVERTPDAVALVHEDTQLTYRELNQRANQLAHCLQQLGVKPETLVGLCVERSLEMIVGLLGILKAGGAYVPLDPTYPPERLAFMLADARVSVLLTQRRLNAEESKDGMKVVYLDEDWERIRGESEANLVNGVMARHAAYIIYTSGSTGTPKGVVVEHRSLVNYTKAASAAYMLGPADRVLQFAPLSFDASAEEIYPCLVRGATLVLRTSSMIDSIPLFLKKCRDCKLTVLGLPTAYWHELTRKIAADALSLPSSLRLVIIGGERALPELVSAWQKHVDPQVRLVNTYGPTESTIVATMYRVPGSAKAGPALREVPIGRPIPNAQVYLLDRFLNVVPIGVPGELHIGGTGLAREYLNQPELTAEKFIPNPYSTEPGARLYKTGDLARYLPTGDIEFLGRLDQQVKVRGFRIELGEVEAALGKHPHVQEALVLAREDVTGGKSLVAYVVPRREFVLTSSNLRLFMQEQLPDYMVPGAFVLLEALPLTPSGKVDRRALPAPEYTRPGLAESFVAPTLPVHQQLVGIWEELLEVRPIGIRDNFFDLGGHSLLAVRLVDRIEQVWGKKISSATLLAGATIEQLSNALIQPEGAASRSVPGVDLANGSRRISSIKSFWSSLIGRRGQ